MKKFNTPKIKNKEPDKLQNNVPSAMILDDLKTNLEQKPSVHIATQRSSDIKGSINNTLRSSHKLLDHSLIRSKELIDNSGMPILSAVEFQEAADQVKAALS
jgi:hypothetical protein